MTPEQRKAARELLAGLWGAVWIYLRAALDQIDEDEGLMRLASERIDSFLGQIAPDSVLPVSIEESERVLRALRARLGPAPEPEP